MKMCRWACGPTLRYRVRNENIKNRLKVDSIAERCRKARLGWFGHVKRRDQDYVGRQTLEMVPPGRRKRGRPTQRWMDCGNRDMRAIGTTKDEVLTELAGRGLCLPQRPRNQVGAARRRSVVRQIRNVTRKIISSTVYQYCHSLTHSHPDPHTH